MTLSITESEVWQFEKELESESSSAYPSYGSTIIEDTVPAVVVDSERVVFNPDAMAIGRPYVFRFLGYWMAVRKATTGALDFFYFADPSEES